MEPVYEQFNLFLNRFIGCIFPQLFQVRDNMPAIAYDPVANGIENLAVGVIYKLHQRIYFTVFFHGKY